MKSIGTVQKQTPLGKDRSRVRAMPLEKLSDEDIRSFIARGWRVRSSSVHVLPR